MIYGKPIEYPPPAFNPGDRVRFLWPEDFEQGGSHYVIASNHTHTQLEGFRYATLNWELKRTHKARSTATEETPKANSGNIRKHDRPKSFKIDSQILPASEIPLKDTRPTGECPIYFSQTGYPQGFQLIQFSPKFPKNCPLEND